MSDNSRYSINNGSGCLNNASYSMITMSIFHFHGDCHFRFTFESDDCEYIKMRNEIEEEHPKMPKSRLGIFAFSHNFFQKPDVRFLILFVWAIAIRAPSPSCSRS